MQRIDAKKDDGLFEEEDRATRQLLQEQYKRLIFQEEIKRKQCSRIKWLEAGDQNTKFFHVMAAARRRVNRINVIAARGHIRDKRQDIEREIVDFFFRSYILVMVDLGLRWMEFH
eukprot:TRINITY_DN17643_c0_g2_i1.p1 TRINITY_DN17643_c0_g2~~TRINITY_DN17643_c0_g2_i1.p1  ORF type:complete len:133 (+),score=23.39 TRINITY_DN17643_c0_g2_i1:57-401(+)